MSDTRRRVFLVWPQRVLRGCLGKVRYSSKSRARAAVRRLTALHNDRKDERTLTQYKCPRCRGWHVGHGWEKR